ncbi:hypothetical protein [Paraburkholderia antibiotica]|uniref:Cystatin domain-containing protein n=1 Tax=Paraburkholderia antibiotica TaxID=2728839 RepID=A0A7X9ZWB7_9BURK|nr:hypothetical protein [Paraburkholderia antibiotica]NML30787.1 hypothetical protein [Paraburkholderia antibiotica]
MKRALFALALAAPGVCVAKLPAGLPCPSWPTNIAEVALKNAKIVDIADLDESKTQAQPIAIQQIGKDLYRQVYSITFHSKSGKTFHVITVNNASSEECSMSDVTVYQASKIPE